MINSQRSHSEINLLEEGKEIGINKVIRSNKIINISLKT